MLPTRRLERKFFGNLQKLIMLKGYFNFLLTVSFVQYLTRNDAYSLNAHIFQFDYFIFFFSWRKLPLALPTLIPHLVFSESLLLNRIVHGINEAIIVLNFHIEEQNNLFHSCSLHTKTPAFCANHPHFCLQILNGLILTQTHQNKCRSTYSI